MYKKHTVTWKAYPCNHQSMARPRNNNKTSLKLPEVTFSLEARPVTPAQLEAGKRLFSRLLAKAQTNIESQKDTCQKINGEGRRGRVGGSRRPLKPPSLTNRGALSSKRRKE